MLTARQSEILRFMRDYQLAQGVPPSGRVVAERFGIRQPSVHKHLGALARKGRLTQLADGKWGLPPAALRHTQLRESPIYGVIPAGLATEQEQAPEGSVGIDPRVFGLSSSPSGDLWFLRVSGDSMTGANIFDGDLVALVRREPHPGDIIAALVDETTTTLKRLAREGGRLVLRAENPRYPDIHPRQLQCQGVMVGLIRRQSA
jgi:repressor LexA